MINQIQSSIQALTHSPQSKVWVYKSNQPIPQDTSDSIQKEIDAFTSQWKVHGQPLKSFGYIIANQILIFVTDDTIQPSGCSIDSSVKFVKEIETKYDLNLLSNDLVYYIDNNELKSIAFQDMKSVITPQTWVLNPHFKDLEDLQKNLLVQAEKSMYKRLL